jgi:sensor histidine kinase YesM
MDMSFLKWLLRLVWWGAVFALVALLVGSSEIAFLVWIIIILLFYFNRFLFRQVLRRGYFISYFLLALVQIVGFGLFGDSYLSEVAEPVLIPTTNGNKDSVPHALLLMVLMTLVLLVNLQVTIVKDWFRSVFIEKRLAKTEHQLARVKLNPHFFKNVLNDLYSLVYLKKDEAAPAVVELKALMEYVIYDADVNYIPLRQELDAIKQLVNIQKHRLPPHVLINFQMVIDNDQILVPPMVLFPFIENVFRHADLTSEGALIDIKLRIKKAALMYRVKPTINTTGGIGNTTLENRLYESYGLLGYTIDNKQEDGYYFAKLEIFSLKSVNNEN